MIGPVKLANEMCAASVARMTSANKTSVGSKQSKPSQAIPFLLGTLERKASAELFSVQTIVTKPKTFRSKNVLK
jgi:hypothetical protein